MKTLIRFSRTFGLQWSFPGLLTACLLAGNARAQTPPPLAVFAWETNRPSGSKVIDMSSGHSTITGRIHCNSDIDVSGTANYFRTGVVEYVTDIHPVPDFQ